MFGGALLDVQYGDTSAGPKPFGEELPREIWKIVEDSGSPRWCALDVFMKKPKSGIGTPETDKDLARWRLHAPQQHYDETNRKAGET